MASSASGNDRFLAGDYSAAARAYTASLEALDSKEESSSDAAALQRAVLLCNRAAANYANELYRKCVKDCDAAIKANPHCLRAYSFKGQALLKRGKKSSAASAWRAGVQAGATGGDVAVYAELRAQLDGTDKKAEPAGAAADSTPDAASTGVTPAPAAPAPAVPRSSGDAGAAEGPKAVAAASPAAPPLAAAASRGKPETGSAAAEEVIEVVGSGGSVDASAPRAKARGGAGSASKETARSKKAKRTSAQSKRKDGATDATDIAVSDTLDKFRELAQQQQRSPMAAARAQAQLAALDPKVLEAAQFVLQGHAYVNGGQFDQAIRHFTLMVRKYPRVSDAYLGRGSAYAMLGQYDAAIADFSMVISLRPRLADAFKRRGQTRAAAGLAAEGLSDLARAIALDPDDLDAVRQRGMCLYQMKDFRKALADLTAVAEAAGPGERAAAWNQVGQCLNSLGRCDEAIAAYKRSIAADGGFKDAWVNKGQCHRNYGDGDAALAAFGRALEIDPSYSGALHLRGLLFHGLGKTREALTDFHRGLMLNPSDGHCMFMAAVCLHTLGNFPEAQARYEQLFAAEPEHLGYCQLEISRAQQTLLDVPMRDYNLDNDLSPVLKEGFAKRWSKKQMPAGYRPTTVGEEVATRAVVLADAPATAEAAALVRAADGVGSLLQCSSPGFLNNRRQHRQFGLGAIALAQLSVRHWADAAGAQLPDVSSSLEQPGASPRAAGATHVATWRDVYDVCVRWRQLSEPFDPVWWIDRLTRESFEDGFGLQTPLVQGQMEVVRYFPQFPTAFPLFKRLIGEQCPLTDDMRDAIMAASSCDEVYAIMNRDFWVVTPCYSTVYPGRVYEGTRLTLIAAPPDGYEFTIRTACLPERARQFDEELAHWWGRLTELMRVPAAERDVAAVEDAVLSLFFYWCNLGPLTRGTAAVGLSALVGMAMGAQLKLHLPTPPGKQLDWEAILTPKREDFVANTRAWVFGDGSGRADSGVALDAEWPEVSSTFSTLRQAIEGLNVVKYE